MRTCAEIFVASLLLEGHLGVILGAGGIQEGERGDEDEEKVEDGEERAPPSASSHLEMLCAPEKKANRMAPPAFIYAMHRINKKF